MTRRDIKMQKDPKEWPTGGGNRSGGGAI